MIRVKAMVLNSLKAKIGREESAIVREPNEEVSSCEVSEYETGHLSHRSWGAVSEGQDNKSSFIFYLALVNIQRDLTASRRIPFLKKGVE